MDPSLPAQAEIRVRTNPDPGLTGRYRRLLLAVSLPLFLLVLYLAMTQYRDQRTQVLQYLAQSATGYSIAIEGIAERAKHHVLQMKAWVEHYMSAPPGHRHRLRAFLAARTANGAPDGYMLDNMPETIRGHIGQAGVVSADPRWPGVDQNLVDMALDFFAVARFAHGVTQSFQWSYFFSADQKVFSAYPWVAGDDLVRAGGYTSLFEARRGWFGYELYLGGTPERNPRRTPYWTAPYVDAGGTGSMVAHCAPVYVDAAFLGIVGADLRLDSLEQFLRGLPAPVGRLLILDERRFVLADTGGGAVGAIRSMDEVLPGMLDAGMLDKALASQGRPTAAGVGVIMARAVEHAPWTLVYLVGEEEIRNLLSPRLVPYAIILAALAATVIAALYLLRREFIRPALALVTYIREAALGKSVVAPRLPPLWQRSVAVVGQAFADTREANRKLKESEAFKSGIVENALLGIVTVDESGRVVEFNPAATTMFGYRREQAIGRNLTDLIVPPAYRQAHSEGMARYLRGGETKVLGKRMELSALRADSVELPVEMSISVNRIGEARFFTAFIADLTQKQAAEAALRASEEQYRLIFDATSDAMILWDKTGVIVDLNPAAWRLGGYTKKEFLAIPLQVHIHPSSSRGVEEFLAAVHGGKSVLVEGKAIHKDGGILYLETRTIPMSYRGKPHVLSVSRDVTKQKRAAEELARQREALRQNEKLSAMGGLLASVAHELNNPLAILMGRAALLQDKAENTILRDDAAKINAAAERCGRIVRAFLDMARQRPAKRRPTGVNEVVTAALDLLGNGLQTANIEVETALAAELPLAEADGDQIGQVVINLLLNAQHALEDAPPPRRIRVQTYLDANRLCLRIADTGPGVPGEIRSRIFDPFFTTKTEGAGTGIGLSVCRSIVREHNGRLMLEDTAQGATFLVELPLSAPPSDATAPVAAFVPACRSIGHVLIVDDEPQVAAVLAEILESAGLRASQIHSGRDAMDWLANHECDFILLDIRMPEMDGPAFWRALGERHPQLSRRVAFVTGDTLSAGVAHFLTETGLPALEKPFTAEEVLALVARIEAS